MADAGTMVLLVWPLVFLGRSGPYRLLDVGGMVTIAGLLSAPAASACRNARDLNKAETGALRAQEARSRSRTAHDGQPAASAVETAVVHNFMRHEPWTRADRRRRGRARRLARFHLAGGVISMGADIATMKILVGTYGMDCLPANGIAVASGSVSNFLAGDPFVFPRVTGQGRIPVGQTVGGPSRRIDCGLSPPAAFLSPARTRAASECPGA